MSRKSLSHYIRRERAVNLIKDFLRQVVDEADRLRAIGNSPVSISWPGGYSPGVLADRSSLERRLRNSNNGDKLNAIAEYILHGEKLDEDKYLGRFRLQTLEIPRQQSDPQHSAFELEPVSEASDDGAQNKISYRMPTDPNLIGQIEPGLGYDHVEVASGDSNPFSDPRVRVGCLIERFFLERVTTHPGPESCDKNSPIEGNGLAQVYHNLSDKLCDYVRKAEDLLLENEDDEEDDEAEGVDEEVSNEERKVKKVKAYTRGALREAWSQLAREILVDNRGDTRASVDSVPDEHKSPLLLLVEKLMAGSGVKSLDLLAGMRMVLSDTFFDRMNEFEQQVSFYAMFGAYQYA